MKNVNIWVLLGIFIVGVAVGIFGTISFMDGEPTTGTAPTPIEEKERVSPVDEAEEKEMVSPVDEATVPPVVENTEEDTDTEENENVTPPPRPPYRPMGVNTSYFEGPFGVDSQKLLNPPSLPSAYVICVVSKLDLEKNDDGTWYVYKFRMSNMLDLAVFFAEPYPQQNDLKEGDFISVKASLQPYKDKFYYDDAKILDNISSQSANCNIDNIGELSVPGEIGNVTGVIMAVEITANDNPEPDNPSDYLIAKAVMKCADGNLYLANFGLSSHHPPSHDAFGEGNVVTVGKSFVPDHLGEFAAYYKKEK